MKIAELRKQCQTEKLKQNTGLTLLNRRVSIYLTRFFILLNISANQISVCGIIVGILGSLLFIPGKWVYNMLGIILLYISFTFDQVDGELARYHNSVSLNGVYLDEIRHLVIYSLMIFCLSFPAAQELNSHIPFFLGFIGALVLIISRIEERLPSMIFTEKVILKHNFSGGNSHELLKNNAEVYEKKGNASNCQVKYRNTWRRVFASVFYRGFQFISHQVAIIMLLFMATVLDHFFLAGDKFLNKLSMQSLFLIIFSCLGFVVLIRTVYGHFHEQRVRKICSNICSQLRRM